MLTCTFLNSIMYAHRRSVRKTNWGANEEKLGVPTWAELGQKF